MRANTQHVAAEARHDDVDRMDGETREGPPPFADADAHVTLCAFNDRTFIRCCKYTGLGTRLRPLFLARPLRVYNKLEGQFAAEAVAV